MKKGSVSLTKDLIEKAEKIGKNFHRSASKQIEHWANIGAVAEANPDLSYNFLQQIIKGKAEQKTGKLSSYRNN